MILSHENRVTRPDGVLPTVKASRSVLAMAVVLALFCGGSAGCATVASTLNPRSAADQIASAAGMQKRFVSAGEFDLCTYARIGRRGAPLTVYIEGDGLAWKGRNRLSSDPTPLHPMVLRLAARDASANVVYLARPGQYTLGPGQRMTSSVYWSSRRFSEEVVASADAAIDFWLRSARSDRVHLVGYSGGAAVGVLVAARRDDVASLKTIAGNLDPELVNRAHRVSPLSGSLDPKDVAPQIATIPQIHFVGSDDEVVPLAAAESFRAAAENAPCLQIVRVEGVGHQSGWLERWGELSAAPAGCP